MSLTTIFAKVNELEKRVSSLCDTDSSKPTLNLDPVNERLSIIEASTDEFKKNITEKINQFELKIKQFENNISQISKMTEYIGKQDSKITDLKKVITEINSKIQKLESA